MKVKSLRPLLLLPLLLAGCKKPGYHNVLLVTVDGLRADAPGYAGGAAATPALDRLAREGVRLDRLATPAPLTLPAHASLLTGIHPPEHGLRIDGFGRLPPAIATITESFDAAGFATAAFLTSPRLAALHGLDRAFAVYDAPEPGAAHALLLHAPLALTPGPAGAPPAAPLPPPFPDHTDSAAAGRFRAWLGRLKPGAPWFAWVQLSSPALPRLDAAGRPLDAADTNGYLRAVEAADAAIGTVLDALAASPGAAGTVVCVTAPSGESLGENGETGHGLLLRAPTRQVPGLLRLPGGRGAGTRLPFSTSLVQMAPTLLDLAAVKPHKTQKANWTYLRWLEPARPLPIPETPGAFFTPSRADSLAPLLHGHVRGSDAAVYCETEQAYALLRWRPLAALQVGNWVYIKNEPPELYDLNEDPRERANLASTLPDSVERLDIRLDRFKEEMASRPPVDTSESNAAWRVMAALGASGQPAANAGRSAAARPRIGLPRPERKAGHPGIDAALAAQVFRLYPLLAVTSRADTVRAQLDDCIAQSPGTSRFYVWRAMLDSGDTNAAEAVVADLAHAAEVQPEDTGIAALLGKAHYEAGNYRAALLQLRQTRKRDPGNAIAAELLPQLLFIAANEASRAEDAGEALRLVEELIMFQPTLENRMWRVRLLIARQRNTQARQELRNILYANPDYFPARDLLDRLR